MDRLSQIETMWSLVQDAHEPNAPKFGIAQRQLLDRYGGAVRRYALAALRDPDAANEVFQEFALKFVQGDYGRADPAKGRFRSFIKTSLYHLIVDYQRRRGRQNARQSPLVADVPDIDDDANQLKADEEFLQSWRADLLDRVWKLIEQEQNETGKFFHTVLRVRVEHPEVRSPELAELVSQATGKPITPGNVRVLLHRARERFGDLLINEVAHTLPNASADAVEQELIDLDLWKYCKAALDRLRETAN